MTEPDTTSPTYKLAPIPNPKRKIILGIIGVLVLAAIAALGYYYQDEIEKYFVAPVRPDAFFVISAGTFPGSIVQVYEDMESPVLVTVPETGERLKVIDAAYVGTSTAYYLISDGLYTKSNVYRQNLGTSTRGLEQLTDTDSLKMHLSVAPQGDLIAYEVMEGSEEPAGIQLFQLNAGKVTRIGRGTNPVVSPDGQQVGFERDFGFMAYDLLSEKETPLLSLKYSAPAAIDMAYRTIATYNAETKSIDQYSFSNMAAAQKVSSKKISFVPAALAYGDGILYYATKVAKDAKSVTIGTLRPSWSITQALPEGSRFEDLSQYEFNVVRK